MWSDWPLKWLNVIAQVGRFPFPGCRLGALRKSWLGCLVCCHWQNHSCAQNCLRVFSLVCFLHLLHHTVWQLRMTHSNHAVSSQIGETVRGSSLTLHFDKTSHKSSKYKLLCGMCWRFADKVNTAAVQNVSQKSLCSFCQLWNYSLFSCRGNDELCCKKN